MAEVQLVIVDGPNAGREFGLSGAITIGRDPSAGIVLDDPEASRRHASMTLEDDVVTVEDLGSTNGTYIGSQRVTSPVPVALGTSVRLGKTIVELRK